MNFIKPERHYYNSQQRHDKVRNKTRLTIGDAFERWRWLKAENLEDQCQSCSFCLLQVKFNLSLANLILSNVITDILNILFSQIML